MMNVTLPGVGTFDLVALVAPLAPYRHWLQWFIGVGLVASYIGLATRLLGLGRAKGED